MSPGIVILLVSVFVMMDTIVVGAVLSAGTAPWKELMQKFPATDPVAPGLSREFQSVRLGMLNLGKCAHITIDDFSLHLRPAKLGRMLGLGGLSIPYAEIAVSPLGGAPGKYREATIAGHLLLMPAWCVEEMELRQSVPIEV
jgi:hypothetical protein